MSLNSLANAAMARRPEVFPIGAVPGGLDEIAIAAETPQGILARVAGVAPPAEKQASTIDTASNVLFGYIPTEILTLYVAVLAAIQQPETNPNVQLIRWITFWSFLVATPIVAWLVFAAKVKATSQPLPLAARTWPMWEMSAAIIAYCAWALALPNSPFAAFKTSWYSSAVSGVIVLVASTVLGLLAPFFQRPLKV
jgi:hypothetical protein